MAESQLTPEAVDQAPDVTQADVIDEDALLQELAALSPIAYDRRRDSAAKLLGVRVGALDAEVSARRPRQDAPAGQGTQVIFEDPQPWPSQVQGAALLDELAQVYAAYLILPPGGADALALWTVHTYVYDAWNVTPRLGITSPLPRCGKTRVLEALSLSTPRVLMSSNASPAAIFRAIELWKPTLLIDEADTVLPGNEELRGILNSGHTRRSAYVLRNVGEDHEPRQFSTWAPLAIAMIGKLPGTLADRSLVLRMRRKQREEKVKKFPLDDQAQPFAALRSKCVRWARDNVDALRASTPIVPEQLHDRAADNWLPLCAIATVAGKHWAQRARKTIEALAANAPEDDAIGVLLLTDMQQVFRQQQTDHLFSEDLAKALNEMEERPWPEYGRQRKPISPNQIARALKSFDIRPKSVRIGPETGKGYALDDCQDAFTRYVPPSIPPSHTVTPSHPSNGAHLRAKQTVTSEENVTVEKSQNPASILMCDGVTVQKGGIEAEGYVNGLPPLPKGATPPPYSRPPHGTSFTVGQQVWLYQMDHQPLLTTPRVILAVRNIDGQVDLQWQLNPDKARRWHNAQYALPVGEVAL
jgi:putative DNA primase/helicase